MFKAYICLLGGWTPGAEPSLVKSVLNVYRALIFGRFERYTSLFDSDKKVDRATHFAEQAILISNPPAEGEQPPAGVEKQTAWVEGLRAARMTQPSIARNEWVR
jgi:hypothetical protein